MIQYLLFVTSKLLNVSDIAKKSAAFSSCRFNFFMVFLIPNSRDYFGILLFFLFLTTFVIVMKQISWNSQGIDMPELDFDAVEKWIADVASRQGRGVGQIGYLFCTDEKILEVNRQFLDHDYYTDIITFDYSDSHIISGDIVISLDTVRSNADQFVQPYRRELMRVIIHGILHLCGIDDKGPGEREIMERYEDESLEMIGL